MSAAVALNERNTRTATYAFIGALAMLGLGYASVPLYDLFCRVTGFGGTTQRTTEAEAAGVNVTNVPISMRFDASTARDMPWTFAPEQRQQELKIGERKIAYYTAKNNSDVPVKGTATFNVEPYQAGRHFNKIQCFCFTEQVLQPGEEMRMPVLYFVDPKALDDENMKGVEQITLSYTFHRVEE